MPESRILVAFLRFPFFFICYDKSGLESCLEISQGSSKPLIHWVDGAGCARTKHLNFRQHTALRYALCEREKGRPRCEWGY